VFFKGPFQRDEYCLDFVFSVCYGFSFLNFLWNTLALFKRHPSQVGRIYPMDLRFHGIPSVLLRKTHYRNHLVFHVRTLPYRLDYRPFSHPVHGPSGRLQIPEWSSQLHGSMDFAHFPWFVRHTPFLYGKVDYGDRVPVVRRHLRDRVPI
jgi:hypothetical protein